jgi:hypothetical protein
VDSFDRLREALGTVAARHGLNTVVGPSIWNTVLLINIAQAGTHQVERDYTADEAGHLADLLEYAASDTVDAQGDDDRHEIGSVKVVTDTDSIPPTSVRSLFPLVELHEQGGLGIEYTPGSARDLASLIRLAADMLDPE